MNQKDDFDSPWKEVLEIYFRQFVAFFFPDAYKDIEWRRPYEFLDTELRQVVRDAELGRRLADRLVKVWRRDGEETWVLVHVEVQGQRDKNFPERMYVYNYRLYDRYRRQVASFAVLADENPTWRPNRFEYDLWGCKTGIQFPVVKLVDFEKSIGSEIDPLNPFAVIVETHLRAFKTKKDAGERLQSKTALVRKLYKKGYSRVDIIELFRFIDWMLVLPEDLESRFREDLFRYEEEKQMPYVTSVEKAGVKKGVQQGIRQGIRQGVQEGIRQGVREGILDVLEVRFGTVPRSIADQLGPVTDSLILNRLHRKSVTTASLEEFAEELARSLT